MAEITPYNLGDEVQILQIDKNYGNPYVGRRGIIKKVYHQDPEPCYSVKLTPEEGKSQAELTLFHKELTVIKANAE